MWFGPVFSAEMITGARRLRFYLIRAAYALLLLSIFAGSYSEVVSTASGDSIYRAAHFTSSFFTHFSILQLVAVLLLGPALAGAALSRERQRRTIVCLLVSQLNSAEIVLSKLVAGVLKVGAFVLVGVPILSLTMLFGGIPPLDLLRTVIVTLSTILFVASLSLLVSVFAHRVRDTVAGTYFMLLALLVVPLFVEEFYLSRWTNCPRWVERLNSLFYLLNPFLALDDIEASAVVAGAHLVVALAALTGSCWALRRVERVAASGTGGRGLWRRLPRFRPAVRSNAMLWKELFVGERQGMIGIVFRIGLAVFLLSLVGLTSVAFWNRTDSNQFNQTMMLTGIVVSLVGLLVVAVRGATSIAGEREAETWDTLMSTPLTAREIVLNKVYGACASARWFGLLLLANWCMTGLVEPWFWLAVPFLVVTLVSLTLAAATTGVFFSLWCRTTTRALTATITAVLISYGGYLITMGCLFIFVPTYTWGAPLYNIARLAFFVPFLVAYPYEVGFDGATPLSAVEWPLSYLVGTSFYLIFALVLLMVLIGRFDQYAGRCGSNL